MSDNRKIDVGDVVGEFEVTAVSYNQDTDGNPVNFSYTIRSQKELQDERELAAQLQKELETAEN